MACVRATPTTPVILQSCSKAQFRSQIAWLKCAEDSKNVGGGISMHCSSTSVNDGGLGILREEGEGHGGYLAEGFGWRVRKMVKVSEEMRRVAEVQAEAFHEPVALFNDFFFDFFKAEVLSAVLYRIRNSAPDRYACLVAESINESTFLGAAKLVGVVDVIVQRDKDVLRHLQDAEEYLYVSGIAVLTKFRRKKVATILLEACDMLSQRWGFNYLALRAYDNDLAAQKLYSKVGYRVVSKDPHWITWTGKRRRVLMVKHSPPSQSTSIFYPQC